MIIRRSKLFASSADNKKDVAVAGGLLATGITGAATSEKIGKKLIKKSVNNIENSSISAKDKDIIFGRLYKKAKGEGINIQGLKGDPSNSCHAESSLEKSRGKLAKLYKKLRKSGKFDLARENYENFQKSLKNGEVDPVKWKKGRKD